MFVERGSSVVIFNTHLRISSLYCIIPDIRSKRSVFLVVEILFVECGSNVVFSHLIFVGRIGGEKKKKERSCVSVIAVLIEQRSS